MSYCKRNSLLRAAHSKVAQVAACKNSGSRSSGQYPPLTIDSPEKEEMSSNEERTNSSDFLPPTRTQVQNQISKIPTKVKATKSSDEQTNKNSIDYYKRKRKASFYSISHRSHRLLRNQEDCRLIGRKWPIDTRSRLVPINVLLSIVLVLMVKLFCDINMATAATSGADQSNESGSDQGANLQRFVLEPQDTHALIGQSVDLSCLVENKRGVLIWSRNGLAFGFDGISASFVSHFSLPFMSNTEASNEPLASAQLPQPSQPEVADPSSSSGQQTSNSTTTTNCSLRVKSVSLKDDAQFTCTVSQIDPSHRKINSRSARLNVYLAPTRLSIQEQTRDENDTIEASSSDADEFTFQRSAGGHLEQIGNLQQPSSSDDTRSNPLDQSSADGSIERSMAHRAGSNHEASNQLTDDISASNLQLDNGAGSEANGTTRQLNIAAQFQHNSQAAIEIQSDGSGSNSDIKHVVVKSGTRLRLECRSDQAKPHAELIWLDHQQRRVPNRNSPVANHLNDTERESSYVSESILSESKEHKLQIASLALHLKVERHHSNQVFTCVAKHPTFEMRDHFPQLYGQELRQRVRLEVHYKPEVSLIKDQFKAYENRPIKFKCHAQGKPNLLTYRWFIDGKLVENATEPELRIERLTRQLHLREIKCQVSNSVGETSRSLRLVVQYAPAYVSHLLASQPSLSGHKQTEAEMDSDSVSIEQRGSGNQQPSRRAPDAEALDLARQLAIGFTEGQDLGSALRCDFDSNPRGQNVMWFKVRTNYSLMKDIGPQEADALIDSGLSHASFFQPPAFPQLPDQLHSDEAEETPSDLAAAPLELLPAASSNQDEQSAASIERSKRRRRRLSIPTGSDHHRSYSNRWSANRRRLDYEQMSIELAEEVALYESLLKIQHQYANSTGISVTAGLLPDEHGPKVEIVVPRAPSPSTAAIHEPLQWYYSDSIASGDLSPEEMDAGFSLQETAVSLTSGPAGSQHQEISSQQPMKSLNLVPVNKIREPGKSPLTRRQAPIISSLVPVTRAQFEHQGRYICKTRAVDGPNVNSAARSIYLIKISPPRIISSQQQWAPLGARQVKIECLTQISTHFDNRTAISWFKRGKSIDELRREAELEGNVKTFTIKEELSPDLLFMRSTLIISDSNYDDFANYTCLIQSSKGNDTTDIELKATIQTGRAFAVMASLAVGAILLLVCLISCLLICFPSRSLEAKKAALMAMSCNGGHSNSMMHGDNLKSAHDHQLDAESQSGSLDKASHSATTGSIQLNDEEHAAPQKTQLTLSRKLDQAPNGDQQRFVQSQALLSSMMICDELKTAQQRQLRNDQSDSSDSNATTSQLSIRHQQPHRSSLRQPMVNGHSQQKQQNGRSVAAIRDSLEPRLHLNSSSTNRAAASDKRSLKHQVEHKNGAISELDESKSRIGKFLAKFTMGSTESQRVKSRPIISSPFNSVGGSQHQSSLNTSLAVLGPMDEADEGLTATPGGPSTGNSRSFKHASNGTSGHLISSNTNLIQDSTTASSDGAASSDGRSSSNSSRNNNNSHQQQQADIMRAQDEANKHLVAANQATSYMQQQAASTWLQNAATAAAESTQNGGCSLYVSDLDTGANGSHLYTNGRLTYATGNQGYINQSLNWPAEQHNSSAGHYQYPMGLVSEPAYFATTSPLNTTANGVVQQPCYSTVVYNSDAKQYNNQQAAFNPYGTVPMRPVSHQMVPTSDNGDSFFDSNYGTLIKSSAYKTSLGYANPQINGNNLAAATTTTSVLYNAHHSSNSTSPNSTSTYSTNNNLIAQVQPQLNHLTAADEVTKKQAAAATTMVQADGTTTAIKNLTDNGLATHV